MQGSARLGFGIAALFAAGVAAVYLFGNHESWFVRAARSNAVHCLTAAACPRLTLQGPIITSATPPLTPASLCAKAENWHAMAGRKLVVTCTDGATYLYHMGKLANPAAGEEQWMICAEATCRQEVRVLGA